MMKKLFWLISVVLLTVILTALPVSAYTTNVTTKAVKGSPTVDGVLDPIYQYSDKIIVNNFFNLANSGKDQHKAEMATAVGYIVWDEKFVYTFMTVVDTTPAKTKTTTGSTDAIEVTFDFASINKKGTSTETYGPYGLFFKVCPYTPTYGAPELLTVWSTTSFSENHDWVKSDGSGYLSACKILDIGYTIESRVPYYTKNPTLANGYFEGFSFGYSASILDDVDDDGKRDIKITWGKNDVDPAAGNNLANSASCDKVQLVAAPVIATSKAATTSSAPATFDISAIYILFGVSSLAGGTAVLTLRSKKRR